MLAQMEKDFTDHGYDMDRFWRLKKKTRKYILGRYTAFFELFPIVISWRSIIGKNVRDNFEDFSSG